DRDEVRHAEREHVGLERPTLGQAPFALDGLDEGHPVEEARERIGGLGGAQALAEAAQVGSPLDALPLVCEETARDREDVEVLLAEDIDARRERAERGRPGTRARVERQGEIGADGELLKRLRVEEAAAPAAS